MPGEDFYVGLPLEAQLRKLGDHHSDPMVRHISQYEAALLDRAVARLARPLPEVDVREEFERVWDRLEHLYTTTIVSPSTELQLRVESIPARGRPLPAPEELLAGLGGLRHAIATPRTAQIGLNALARKALDKREDLEELWVSSSTRRSPPADPRLSQADNELLNRALYQPTVAIEESPPVFASLATILDDQVTGWVALLDHVDSPLEIVAVGATIIVVQVARGAGSGLGKGLKERLYDWARPEPDGEPKKPTAQVKKAVRRPPRP